MKFSFLRLQVKPGAMDEVIAEYERHEVLTRSGCVDGWLLRHDDQVTVVATWADTRSYERWLSSPERAASAERLAPLVVRVLDTYVADEVQAVR